MSKRDYICQVKALDICDAAEASKVQMKVMESDSQQRHEVNILSKKNAGKSHRQGNNPAEASTVPNTTQKQAKHSSIKAVTVGIVAVSIRHANALHMVQPVRNAKDGTTLQRCAKEAGSGRKSTN